MPEGMQTSTSTWSSAGESRHSFSHTIGLQAGLFIMIAIAMVTLWLMSLLPFVMVRLIVSILPVVLIGYLGYRLYLTLCTVEFFEDHVAIKIPFGGAAIKYTEIRKITFDSFSHDLLVNNGEKDYRIPRTIQGHRAIMLRLHERVEVPRDHSAEMEVVVRTLPKVACGFSLAAMVTFGIVIATETPAMGTGMVLLCLPLAYILLDQCILRSYKFTPDALYVKGLRGVRSYSRAELKDLWINKSGLSSRFQMTFQNGTVQFDEYLLSKALIQVTGYVERRWQQRVLPLSKRQ